MIPHNPRLEFDIQADPVAGYGDWIRLQVKGPTGDVAQVFGSVMLDPGGILGTDEVAESVSHLSPPLRKVRRPRA